MTTKFASPKSCLASPLLLISFLLIAAVILLDNTALSQKPANNSKNNNKTPQERQEERCGRRNQKSSQRAKDPISRTFDECLDQLEQTCIRRDKARDKRKNLNQNCLDLDVLRPGWEKKVSKKQKKKKVKKGTWKVEKVERAPKDTIRALNAQFARLALRQQKLADRMRGRKRAKVKRKNPNAERQVTEMQFSNKDENIGGDMSVSLPQATQIMNDVQALISNKRRKKRKVGQGLYKLWEKDRPISYHYEDNVPDETREIVEDALQLWMDNTCVRFQEQGPDTDRLAFQDGGGCSSYVGRVGGTQEVTIRTPGCDNIGIVSHEIGHALGFFHEQARPDRDRSVEINMNNVEFWYQNNFAKQYPRDVDYQGQDYDYGSVMHYDPYSFALDNSVPSILPVQGKEQFQETMGQRKKPSFIDFAQVNRAYCSHKCAGKLITCQRGGYPDPNDCRKCRCPYGLAGDFCEEVEASADCSTGGTLEAYSTPLTLSTPNHPNRFSRDASCNWLIRTTPGYKVYIQFEGPFEFHCKDVCDNNYLEIKNETDFRGTGPRFCCSFYPQDSPIGSVTHEMLLIMKNEERHSKRGFKVKYWTDANRDIPGSSPVITTTTSRPTTTTRRTTTTTRRTTTTITTRRTTTTRRITTTMPRTTTLSPVDQCDRECTDWSSWSNSCRTSCGGCDHDRRTRSCPSSSPRCRLEGKRRCNRQPCSKDQLVLEESGQGEFHLLLQGCCFGAFPNKKRTNCGGLRRGLRLFLEQFGVLGKNKRKFKLTNDVPAVSRQDKFLFNILKNSANRRD